MIIKMIKSDRNFWFGWILATFVGWTVGSFVSDAVGDAIAEVWFDSIGLIMLGSMIGGMQWLILRHRVSWADQWLVANIAGWSLGAIANLFTGRLGAGWFLGLISAGVMQWLVLRQQIPRAHWWILVSLVAWVVGIAVSFALGMIGFVGFLSGAVFGIAVGAITGIVMIWLLLEHPKDSNS